MSAGLDVAKFVKVIGLLASNRDGEVVAAANRATAMLSAAGLRWADVGQALAAPASPPVPSVPGEAEASDDEVMGMVARMLNLDSLPAKRRDFLEGILSAYHRAGRLSPRQRSAVVDTWEWTCGGQRS